MKKNFDKEKCTGCGICAMNCPIKIMYISTTETNQKGKAVSYITDESKCINCMICSKMCPYFAINFEEDGKNITFPKLMENIEIPFQCFAAVIFVINFAVAGELRPDNCSEMVSCVSIP